MTGAGSLDGGNGASKAAGDAGDAGLSTEAKSARTSGEVDRSTTMRQQGAGEESPQSHKETYFLPYQVDWIKDPARLRICEKSRQIGMSYADSYDSVRKAAVKGGLDVWVMSRDEEQAKQYILYCKKWAKILDRAFIDVGETLFSDTDGKQIKVQQLRFASGASIYALSSNPDAIVGKTGHVKLDEYAIHARQRDLYRIAKPVIQWGGTLSVISTHRGIGTVFFELIRDIVERGNKMGWSLHRIPIQRAVDEGLVERINLVTGRNDTREGWVAQQRAECIDEEQWQQEYCCIPADEASAFLSYDLIAGCEEAGLRLLSLQELESYLESHAEAALYLGVDIARYTDLCVFDLGERRGDVMWDLVRLELKGKKFSEIRDTLYLFLRLRQMKRACIDATGLGMQVAEEARDAFGYMVEPVTFTPAVKAELAYPMRAAFEDRKLRIVRDEKLRADLRGIKKETTAAGNIRFAGEAADSHCDRFWAKALRQHAAGVRSAVWGALV